MGETVYERAQKKYGDEYANRVTRQYIAAGTAGARATLKTATVASMGVEGFVAGMAIEGVDYAVNLDDYLLGPVLLQAHLELRQAPALVSTRYFAVLRPWSLAFYETALDFAFKPRLLIATSNLDTFPLLRVVPSTTPTSSALESSHHGEEETISSGHFFDLPQQQLLEQQNQQRYIEFCTLDGSTYSLYACQDNACPVEEMLIWFAELRAACKRVESISKYRSGAVDIAEARWLMGVPRGVGWVWDEMLCPGEADYQHRPRQVEGDWVYRIVVESVYIFQHSPCGEEAVAAAEAVSYEDTSTMPPSYAASVATAPPVAYMSLDDSSSDMGESSTSASATERESVLQLMDVTGCSERDVYSALHTARGDINAALDVLLRLESTQDTAQTYSATHEDLMAIAQPVDSRGTSPGTVSTGAKGATSSRSAQLAEKVATKVGHAVRRVRRQLEGTISDLSVTVVPVTLAGVHLDACKCDVLCERTSR